MLQKVDRRAKQNREQLSTEEGGEFKVKSSTGSTNKSSLKKQKSKSIKQ